MSEVLTKLLSGQSLTPSENLEQMLTHRDAIVQELIRSSGGTITQGYHPFLTQALQFLKDVTGYQAASRFTDKWGVGGSAYSPVIRSSKTPVGKLEFLAESIADFIETALGVIDLGLGAKALKQPLKAVRISQPGRAVKPAIRTPEEVFELKTDMPLYDNILANPEYHRTQKGMTGRIEWMSPDEYLQQQAKVKGVELEEDLRIVDRPTIENIKKLMETGERRVPMLSLEPHLGYKHRAIAAKEYGLEKVPVAIIEKAKVKLYRAESPTVKFEDVFDVEKLKKSGIDMPWSGKFYTTEWEYADYFRETYGRDAVIKEIEIPFEDLKKYEVRPGEYIIPEKRGKASKE